MSSQPNRRNDSSSLSDRQFELLTQAYLEGNIGADDAVVLKSYLYDPYYVQCFVLLCKQEQIIHEIFSSDLQIDIDSTSFAGLGLLQELARYERTAPIIRCEKLQPESDDVLVHKVEYPKIAHTIKRSTFYSILANIAAMLLLILFIRYAPTRGQSFAYVIDSYQAQIQGVESGFRTGQSLDEQPLKLTRGLLKIRMNDGSVVLLEAPTEIRLEGNDQLFLIQGKLTAKVPEEAVGFTVRTPSASIIDYGTEFGVLVDQYAETEAHVLKGNVKLGIGSDPRVLKKALHLSANQAGRVSGQSLKKILPRAEQFSYDIPCSFEQMARSLGASMYLRLQSDSVGSFKDTIAAATRIEVNPDVSVVPGPFTGNNRKSYAFRIQGADSSIIIDARRLPQSSDGAFTIGYWVRFDDIRKQVVSGNLINKGGFSHFRSVAMTRDGRLEHFAYNSTAPVKWRIVTSPGPLQPEKWYFVVISRGVRDDNTKTLYLNGKPVSRNAREDEVMKLDSFESFQFGGDIGGYEGFEGEIAEIMFFPRALDHKEVELLYGAVMTNP
jgi:hypothetical protein